MDTQLIRGLEQAANTLLAPPNLITSEQRKEAESIFLQFRKTKSPYNVCREILEASRNDYVKFEAAETLKCALIREWRFLNETDCIMLRDYLMHYVCNTEVVAFVQERLLQVIAIMVKRASVDQFGQETSKFLTEVEALIMNTSQDTSQQVLGCKIIMNLMQEYAITYKSTDVGLPWEVHYQAKRFFEDKLERIFKFCVVVLNELVKSDPPYANNILALYQYILRITEMILNWGTPPRRMRIIHVNTVRDWDNETKKPASLRLSNKWSEIILSPILLPLMFQVYWKVRDFEELSTPSMACLVQLSSLNGPIINPNNRAMDYLTAYMENFMKLVSGVTIKSEESVGVANIILNHCIYFVNDILQLPESLQASYFDEMTRLTCAFIEKSTKEDSTPNGNYAVAFETIFKAWVLILDECRGHSDTFHKFAVQIFNTYLEYHLAPPDGKRPREEEEFEEEEDNDRVKFQDHLQSVGMLGRVVIDHALPMLAKFLEDRIEKLTGRLHAMMQQAMNYNDSIDLENLFEDIHWLVLVAGHTLAMDSDGETPLIPMEVMQYSINECNEGVKDLDSSLNTMACAKQPGTYGSWVEKCDMALRIFCDVLTLSVLEMKANENNLGAFMSPEVGCTLMWFLKRWCLSYLMPVETYYEELSPILVGALGKDTEGAMFVTNFLFEKIQSNLIYSKEEAVLLRDTIEIFSEVVSAKDKSTYIIKTEGLWQLIKLETTIAPGTLPANVRRGLFKGFTLAGSALGTDGELCDYYKQIFRPVAQKLLEIMRQENFNRIYHEEAVRIQIIDMMDKFIGMCKGCTSRPAPFLFHFLSPVLAELPLLFGVYHNYKNIVHIILDLFNTCAKSALWYLENSASRLFYECAYGVVQTYSRFNENRFAIANQEQEDTFEDLSLLLELLSSLVSQDWLDLSTVIMEEDRNVVKASDVGLYGLGTLLPLLSLDLLKYPKLCAQYYRFIFLLGADKIATVNDDMLVKVLNSVQLGITKFDQMIIIICFEFIEAMATHIMQNQLQNSKLHQMVLPFLKLMLDLVLSEQITSALISSASSCMFSLIFCFKEQYQMLVRNLIQTQSDQVIANRLAAEFDNLTEHINTPNHLQKLKFCSRFQQFIANVHGFLLIM